MSKNDIIKYSLIDSGELESDHWAIRIDEGQFLDVVYKYMTISFNGEDEHGNGLLNYNYDIIEDVNGIIESNKDDFEEITAKILNAILEESLKEKDGTNRIDDIEELDPQ